jgi:four helix bundle protein
MITDPYETKQAVRETSAELLEQDEIYQKAIKLARDVQDLHQTVRETPRWEALWDQTQRASSSVALNYAQGCGKLRGFLMNDLLCARGELMETLAALTIGSEPFKALKPQAKELLKLLDERILNTVEKHDRPAWKN